MSALARSWRWPRSGWRLAAAVNTALTCACAALLLALLAWSVGRAGGAVRTNLVFFAGGCDESRAVNLWLHLLLNVFSTIILASSNFFCQVLSSPSRCEVDASHAEGTSMYIGIPSFSNVFRVRKFKGWIWTLFFLSSIPLHLFFNSAIFQTEYQGGHWNLTLASEGFVNGAPYFNPGAMLLPAGMIGYKCRHCGGPFYGEYGDSLQLEDYFDPDSPVSKEIAATSAEARKWRRIEVPECRSQYEFCNARVKYGDVVMVVESQDARFMYNDTGLGWTRDSVLEPLDSLNAKYWDPHVPAADSNSLWFFANCNTTADLSPQTHQAEGCFQTCNRAYGRPERGSQILSADKIEATYNFDFITSAPEDIKQVNSYWPGLKERNASKLELKYCLVEEIDSICKVGLSNELLLAVLICVCIKTALCITVTIVLGGEDPLVVPGDAIVSFMTRPDVRTVGRCTLDRSQGHKKDGSGQNKFHMVGGSRWHLKEGRRWYSALPVMVWLRSYFLFAAVIIFLGFMFRAAQVHNPYNDGKQTLVHSATNGILDTYGSGSDDLLQSVLTANLPQLLLSFSYYVYNSLYTRLCVEKEWNEYSTNYRPLRVTDPKGQQISSYRLQLPYRYSIPLIGISALLHFLVSNTLYVFILEGGKLSLDFESVTFSYLRLP
ncbi:hypothetical protein F5X96DRAFT_676900 [Biscogniauxia mediterranea]|nr:hypothetical protein F5X96DRAFT_676900 [Biscogniauxia mediterranea]